MPVTSKGDEEAIVKVLHRGQHAVVEIMQASGLSYARTISGLTRLIASENVELVRGSPPRYALKQTDLLGGSDPSVASGS
jgi:hypothetical protein